MIALDRLLAAQPLGTHLYVCGPSGMIAWARDRAAALGWPAETVHFEHFAAPQPGAPFDVKLAVSGKTIARRRAAEPAGGDRGGRRRSALSVPRRRLRPVRDQRHLAPTAMFIHNDHWLSEEEHRSGRKIMPCVSRFEGRSLVLER